MILTKIARLKNFVVALNKMATWAKNRKAFVKQQVRVAKFAVLELCEKIHNGFTLLTLLLNNILLSPDLIHEYIVILTLYI
jgi:hypothetical protein